MRTNPNPKIILVPLPDRLCLLSDFFVDVLFLLMVPVLATRLQVQLIYSPVLQIFREGQHAHLLHKVKPASAVKIQNGSKRARMTIKEVFVFDDVVVIAELHKRLVACTVPEFAQAGVGHSVQRSPKHLMFNSSDIQYNTSASLP